MDPRRKARIAGFLYLIGAIAGGSAEIFIRDKLVVGGNAAATAAKILAHESLFRFGGAADLISVVCDTAVALLFYELFAPVNKSLSLMMAFFRIIFVAVMGAITVNHFAALLYLRHAPPLQEQALLSLRLQSLGYNIALVFFGVTCVLLGYLIVRSTFLPRILGVLMAISGIGYLINSFVHLLAPGYGAYAFKYILVPCGIGELALIPWLLAVGVNSSRWQEQAQE
jgi:uncharacterized protein DUF4386